MMGSSSNGRRRTGMLILVVCGGLIHQTMLLDRNAMMIQLTANYETSATYWYNQSSSLLAAAVVSGAGGAAAVGALFKKAEPSPFPYLDRDVKLPIVINSTNGINASLLPVSPTDRSNLRKRKILVIYSGPTDLLIHQNVSASAYTQEHNKMDLYRLNFEGFLRYGVQCKYQDTIIVVTDPVAEHYRPTLRALEDHCRSRFGTKVITALRNNTCLDLESIRVALYGNYVQNVSYYDYVFFMNCGVTGPSPVWAGVPWTLPFINKLNDEVKMTGLSMNCLGNRPHIQSMMFAVDREGLEIILEGEAIFDCNARMGPEFGKLPKGKQIGPIIGMYEVKMGQLIMGAGYGIDPLLRPMVLFKHNKSKCFGDETTNNHSQRDLWITWRMQKTYGGAIPTLDQLIFYKTTRILTEETAKEINYTLKRNFNW